MVYFSDVCVPNNYISERILHLILVKLHMSPTVFIPIFRTTHVLEVNQALKATNSRSCNLNNLQTRDKTYAVDARKMLYI